LQEKIKLVPMDMADKPGWYKKVYPNNQVWLVLHGKKKVRGYTLPLDEFAILADRCLP
jgi:glutathione S-transferase